MWINELDPLTNVGKQLSIKRLKKVPILWFCILITEQEVSWIVSPFKKKICSSPNPCYLWRWLFFGSWPLHIYNYLSILRRYHHGFKGDPQSKAWCPDKKKERTWKDIHREGGHVRTEAEARIMLSQVTECQEPPESRRGKERSLPRAFMVLPTPWFWISHLQNSERINFCCFKPLSL